VGVDLVITMELTLEAHQAVLVVVEMVQVMVLLEEMEQ
jgi:hypothetical protein